MKKIISSNSMEMRASTLIPHYATEKMFWPETCTYHDEKPLLAYSPLEIRITGWALVITGGWILLDN